MARKTTGDVVKKQLQQRGLIYFDDVLDEARIAIELMHSDVRAALAIAVAERVLNINQTSLPDEVATYIAEAKEMIARAWHSLQHREDVESCIRTSLLSQRLLESDCADNDSVAAAIYAAKVTITGDAGSLMLAISRLLDTVFSLVYSEDFLANCADPVVQAELVRIRSMLSAASERESVGVIVNKLRTLSDAVG
jgi:hypothetical protein